MRSRRTCCRRKVCPFWLARPPSERFCSDRSRTSGHCTSRGRLGSKLGFVGDALVPASHYIHPEFGFFCPTPRFHRRLRGALATADKPSCVGDTRTEGNCVSVKLRKPRMVWVANDRPAIAAVALGRSVAPTTGSIDAALLTARAGSLAARNRVQRRL